MWVTRGRWAERLAGEVSEGAHPTRPPSGLPVAQNSPTVCAIPRQRTAEQRSEGEVDGSAIGPGTPSAAEAVRSAGDDAAAARLLGAVERPAGDRAARSPASASMKSVMEGDATVLRRPKPRQAEDTELEQRRAELGALAANLADGEVEVATLKVQRWVSERQRQTAAVRRAAELADSVAGMAEGEAAKAPADTGLRERARAARSRATEAATALHNDPGAPDRAFAPSEELRSLFHAAVKAMHPELANDDEDRLRRQQWIAESGKAYARSDVARLRQLLAQWQPSAGSVPGEGVDVEMIRVRRKIAQARRRLDEVSRELTALMTSDPGMRPSQTRRE